LGARELRISADQEIRGQDNRESGFSTRFNQQENEQKRTFFGLNLTK